MVVFSKNKHFSHKTGFFNFPNDKIRGLTLKMTELCQYIISKAGRGIFLIECKFGRELISITCAVQKKLKKFVPVSFYKARLEKKFSEECCACRQKKIKNDDKMMKKKD